MNKFNQAAAVLREAVAKCQEILGPNDHQFLGIQFKVTQEANRLEFLGGRGHSNTGTPSGYKKTPLTSFMGEPLKTPKPVTVAEIDPKEQERQLFLGKIERLENNLDKLTNDVILESYQNDQSVIRGMAKRAGLEDYKTAEINGTYLNQIREARMANEEEAAKKAEDEAKMKAAEESAKKPVEETKETETK